MRRAGGDSTSLDGEARQKVQGARARAPYQMSDSPPRAEPTRVRQKDAQQAPRLRPRRVSVLERIGLPIKAPAARRSPSHDLVSKEAEHEATNEVQNDLLTADCCGDAV